MSRFPLLRSLAWFPAALLAPALAAQTVDEGYQATVRALPAAAGYPAVMPAGLVWFDGLDVQFAPPNQPVQSLLTLPQPRFGAFTLPLDPTALLFADSSVGEVWWLSTGGAPARHLATMPLPYDAAVVSATHAIVSARTGGFGATTNDLLAIDLVTGATIPVGLVGGASGPIAVDAQGNILYATAPLAFPPPPASVQVLRWTQLQWLTALVGGTPMTDANAQVVFSGLDAASDLALDGDDDILFVDWLGNRIGELNDVSQLAWRTDLADYGTAPVSPAALQFLPATNGHAFEPFAATAGGSLLVHETDFFSTSQLRQLQPAPANMPLLPGPVPAGPFALQVQGGPRLGLCLFALGLPPASLPVALSVGLEQPLAWDPALLQPVGTALIAFDASGTAQLGLANPGSFAGLQILAAAAFLDQTATAIGSTAPAVLLLGP